MRRQGKPMFIHGARRGENAPNAKLSNERARQIRREYEQAAGGVTYKQLAEKHGVTKSTIRRVCTGETYSD